MSEFFDWLVGLVGRFLGVLCRVLFRYFLTGQSVFGRPTDNATFFHAASTDMRGKPYEKLSAPIWQRLARRWAVAGVPLCFMAMSVVARVAQEVAVTDQPWMLVGWLHMAYRWWAVLGLGLIGFGSWRAVQFFRYRKVTNEFVYPTWEAACKVLGLAYHRSDARRMVSLPAGFEPANGREVDGPAQHHWLTRWTGIARWLDRRAERAQAQAEAQLALEQEQREAADESAAEDTVEPDTIPSTELVVRDKPGWLVYPRRRPRAGSTAISEEAVEPPVRIELPPGRCGSEAQQKAFLNAVGPVLGMPEPQANFELVGSHPYVLLRPTRLPPAKLTFAEVKKYFEASTLTRPFVGVAAGGRPVYLDLENESPHTMLSGGTGTGKSTLLKNPLPIRMHLGVGLIMADFKRVSHLWAHNLPGCFYAWKIEQIHNVFVALGNELMGRIGGVLPDSYAPGVDLAQFQVWDIVVEEINSLTPMLQRYWQEIRGPKDPVPSPAITAIQQTIFMGREMGLHVWIGSQRAAANVFGGDGGSTRENFAARLMAKWTKQTWSMLAGGIPWMKFPKTGSRGIWALIQNDEAEIIRVPLLTNAEARAWAMSGVPSPDTPLNADLMEPAGVVVPAGVSVPELVTLSKALKYLPGPAMTIGAIRMASHREGFPEPAGPPGGARTYSLQELTAWKQELDARKGLQDSWDAGEPRRPGWVYRFDVLDLETGATVLGYVGQTHWLDKREAQHRGDKPWADLIVGSITEIWSSDACTQDELDEAEQDLIHELLPLYNIEHNEDNPNRVQKWDQIEARQARNAAKGLPPWVPRDVYNEERAAAL